MKYIYVLGQEHSGSTLISQVLASNPSVIALGEVSNFFSTSHMKQYMNKWGKYPVAHECSCGEVWSNCEFWQPLNHLSGLNSEESLLNKYKIYFEYLRSHYPNSTFVDSSKSFETLKLLIDNHLSLELQLDDLIVIYNIKDVRSFTASMIRKSNKQTLNFCFHTFNYWLGCNQNILHYLKDQNINFIFNLYELFCNNPKMLFQKISNRLGILYEYNNDSLNHNLSHILLSNKDFLLRNCNEIKYDLNWFYNENINILYTFHYKARNFNARLYSI